jgi:putative toxin-antitoxin system antitoxin component (TIGR02293 family)
VDPELKRALLWINRYNEVMSVQVCDLLGGERVLGPAVKSNLDLVRATREGLPAEAANHLALQLHGGVGKTEKMLKSLGTRLSPEDSDQAFRTASVLAQAITVLGDTKKAAQWLSTLNRALGGEIPLDLLDTSAGKQEVETILDRIEYGVYS